MAWGAFAHDAQSEWQLSASGTPSLNLNICRLSDLKNEPIRRRSMLGASARLHSSGQSMQLLYSGIAQPSGDLA